MNSHGTAAHELWLCIQSTGASIQCGFLNVSFDPLMPNIGIIEHLAKSVTWNGSFCNRTTNWWDVISHKRNIKNFDLTEW
jgi:hypothetical protein